MCLFITTWPITRNWLFTLWILDIARAMPRIRVQGLLTSRSVSSKGNTLDSVSFLFGTLLLTHLEATRYACDPILEYELKARTNLIVWAKNFKHVWKKFIRKFQVTETSVHDAHSTLNPYISYAKLLTKKRRLNMILFMIQGHFWVMSDIGHQSITQLIKSVAQLGRGFFDILKRERCFTSSEKKFFFDVYKSAFYYF